MAKPCTYVSKGIAYNHIGEKLGRVEAEDGYYLDKLPKEFFAKGVPPVVLDQKIYARYIYNCHTINSFPALMHADNGEDIGAGEIDPPLPVGSYVEIIYGSINNRTDYYYYCPAGKQSVNPIEVIARWWTRFPFESPWVKSPQGEKLNTNLRTWIKEYDFNPLDKILGVRCEAHMLAPSALCENVGELCKRQLSFIRGKLNRQLSPIGAEITKIVPTWSNRIALCHVWFTIDGVDPTKGQGCMVYKDCMFFYGPYCQRIGQQGTSMSYTFLHQAPPIYTLATWINGPLYSTREKLPGLYTDQRAKTFKSEKMKLILPGTDSTNKLDYASVADVGSSDITEAARPILDQKLKDRIAEISRAFRGVKPQVESYKPDVYYQIAVRRSNNMLYGCVYDHEGQWRYAIVYTDKTYYEQNNISTHSFWVSVEPKILWGAKGDVTDFDRFVQSALEYSVPLFDCKCITCRALRRDIEIGVLDARSGNISPMRCG